MSQKKVLYIVQSGKLGGAEISMLLLIKNISKNKFKSYVLAPENSDVYVSAKELDVNVVGFTLPRIKSFNPVRLIKSFFLVLIYSYRIKNIIIRYNIALVHTMSNKRSAIFGILAARLAKIPVIWTIRNLDWLGVIDQFMMAHATKLIAVSDAINNLFNRKNKKFVKIYNAIDLSDFDLKLNYQRPLLDKMGLESTDFAVAMVGRLTPEKGHIYFIEAASKLLEKESKIKFFIIGEKGFYGNYNYYNSLVNRCRELDIENQIRFIDFEKDIVAIMATIDLLVLYSENEPFGRVLIEAMAMAKPVVASDAGGPKEIVEHNKTGILVKPKNVDQLADAIFYFYKNPDISRKIGAEGRKRVIKYFTIDKYVENHENLYHEILNLRK